MGFNLFSRIFKAKYLFKNRRLCKTKLRSCIHFSILIPLLCITLVACGGGNTQSGGIDINVLAGNYTGTFSFTATPIVRPEAASVIQGSATAQVSDTNRLVLDLSNGVSILASLTGSGSFSIDVAASDTIVDVSCSQGVLTISGQFEVTGNANATVSSQDLVCDGLDVTLVGSIDLMRS